MNSADSSCSLSIPPAPRRVLPLLSNSEKRCFQSCKRKHYIRYRLLKRPLLASAPQRFGSLVHMGLEAWWLAAKAGGDRLAAALEAVRTEKYVEPIDLVRAEELLAAYDVRWAYEVVEVLAVEIEFEAPITNPETGATSRTYALGGKIDAIARLADGRVVIVEHKTSSEDISGGSDYWKRLRLDSQVSDYFVGARALGFDVEGCLYDVIGKPKLQPFEATPVDKRQYKKDGSLYASQRDRSETLDEYRARLRAHLAENLDRYYQRGIVVRLEEDERDAAFDTWQTAREVRDADRLERHPRNPNACVQWGTTCEFFAVCAREADLDDPTRYRTAKAPHEELSTPAPRAA
jgi:hypothetical protein